MNNLYVEQQQQAFLRCKTEFEDTHRYRPETPLGCFTLIWQRKHSAKLMVDGLPMKLQEGQVLALGFENRIDFTPAEGTVIIEFNRDFYCVIDHDKVVSCSGILFWGAKGAEALTLGEVETEQLEGLLLLFAEEFKSEDNLQGEMLRILLKRMIIILTRLAKKQLYSRLNYAETDLDAVRTYSRLVDVNYRQLHTVTEYAAMMNKSPKTLSNLFHLFYSKTPLQVIHERITLEAKRMLMFTDKSTKEIGFDLGFDDASKFSRFFKTQTGHSPTGFKEGLLKTEPREELVS